MGKVLRFLRPAPDAEVQADPPSEPVPAPLAFPPAAPTPASPAVPPRHRATFPVVPEGWPVLEVEVFEEEPPDPVRFDATFDGLSVNYPPRCGQFWPGTIECSVAGVTQYEGALRLAALRIGQPVLLQREPENSYDANAVKVLDCEGDRHIGYLPREVAAQQVARAAPHGLLLGVWHADGERVGVRLLIANGPLRLKTVPRPAGEAELVAAATAELPPDVTLREWTLVWLGCRGRANSTVSTDRRLLDTYVFPYLGGTRLADLTPDDCARWAQTLDGVAKSPRARCSRVLNQSLIAAYEQGRCDGPELWGIVTAAREPRS